MHNSNWVTGCRAPTAVMASPPRCISTKQAGQPDQATRISLALLGIE
jgi:hypothetical protein